MKRIILRTESTDHFTRTFRSQYPDGETLALAKRTLEGLGDKILLEGDFESSTWVLSDGTKKRTFCFDLTEEAFAGGAAHWSGCTLEEYVTTVKAHTALQLGTVILDTLAAAAKEALWLAGLGEKELSLSRPGPRTMSILFFLPPSTPEREALFEGMESGLTIDDKGNAISQREIPPLETCLHFDHWLDEFWKAADKAARKDYFPVWLWWKLTSILPMRPKEFALTPRDCIGGEKEARTLTVRRTRLKKHKGGITYRVEGDYKLFTYPIPDSLAEEILWYCAITQPGKEGLLFGDGASFSYGSLRLLLQDMCTNWVQTGDVGSLRLGDTRHLAMINLIISGSDPSACRALANHATISQSAWYFSNIKSLTDSMAFMGGHEQGTVDLVKSPYRYLPKGTPFHEVPGGRCDACQVAGGDTTECLESLTEGMHLGDCRGCRHFYPYTRTVSSLQVQNGPEPELDTLFLTQMVEQMRKGKGNKTPLGKEWEEVLEKHRRKLCQDNKDKGNSDKGNSGKASQ